MPTIKQRIVPHLWFDQEAKEAAEFYCSIFPDSEIFQVTKIYDTPSGDCDVVTFSLSGVKFQAISAGPLFQFNESISFEIVCETQEEIDYYFEKLSAVPESEQCGWLKDKYGLSWQVVPAIMEEMMKGTPEQIARVTSPCNGPIESGSPMPPASSPAKVGCILSPSWMSLAAE